jgi:hypothetical protein
VTAPAPAAPLVAPVAEQPVALSTVSVESQATQAAAVSLAAQAAATGFLISVMAGDDEAWYDTDRVTKASKDTGRVVDSFSIYAARITDAFIADAINNLSGRRYRPVGIRKTVGLAGELGVRQGVTTAGVIGRAADTYRYQQSLLDKQFIADVKAGVSTPTELTSPLDAAVERVRRGTQLNVALAIRNQAKETMAGAADQGLVVGYRRVLHAELAHEGSCGLCIADSTRIYRTDHLMAMHPECHCVPMPVGKNADIGELINARDLGRFYADAGGTSAEKLRETRYKVDEHGEIGPVLRPHGEPIRTQEQARRDTNRARPKTPEQAVRTLRNKRDALLTSYARAARGQTDPAWRDRLDGIQARIARLETQIVKLEARR